MLLTIKLTLINSDNDLAQKLSSFSNIQKAFKYSATFKHIDENLCSINMFIKSNF